MTRAKVVHFHKMVGVSGSEKHLEQLLAALDRRAFEPTLVMLRGSGADRGEAAYAARLRSHGVRVESLRIRGDLDPWLFLRLVRWLRRERPDIVHTHLIHADAHAVPAARAAGVPVIVSTKHNDDPFRGRRAVIALERWLGRRVHRTIAISAALREFLLASTGLDPAAVVTVRYGYDPALDHHSGRTAVPAPAGALSVIAVGRLVPQKGHDVLIRAFRTVVRDVPDARLLIVGDGEGRASLAALIRACGLEGCVTLAGHRPDIASLLRGATVLAHPSRWEGFGLVLLEAMAVALPVVATRVSAIPEIIEDGVSGLLVPADDEHALASALVRVLRDHDLARRLGAAGRERQAREFSIERMARGTEEIYRQALRESIRIDAGRADARVC